MILKGALIAVALTGAASTVEPDAKPQDLPDACFRSPEGASANTVTCRTSGGDLTNFQLPVDFDATMEMAARGDRDAMRAAGEFRIGNPAWLTDEKAARYWFSRGAEAGDPIAMSYLGTLLREEDLDQAVRWYRRSAELGYSGGLYNIALFTLEGWGVEPDPDTALRVLAQAADAGSIEAMLLLGYCYAVGHQVEKSPQEALKWFNRAAETGEPDALVNFGRLLEAGYGVPQDQPRAVKLFREAAEKGDPRGMLFLGMAYDAGMGVPADVTLGFFWFSKAAEWNLRDAIVVVHSAYSSGRGVQKDPAKAAVWRERLTFSHDWSAWRPDRSSDAVRRLIEQLDAELFAPRFDNLTPPNWQR